MYTLPRLIIAGIRGGSGKTTLSLALISALRSQKGKRVIPFKKGPDYIDAGWMSIAAENPCYNLDPFLIPRKEIVSSLISHFNGDVAVIEGNRGLYDGVDSDGSYSTAELAKLLKCPILLIIDCTKMTRTAAALVLGCMNLDREVKIKGVVLNQVSGTRHESVIRESIERYCSLPVLGAIPRFRFGEFPERHMGLTPYQEHPDTLKALSFVEEIAKKHLDIDGMLRVAMASEPISSSDEKDIVSRGLESHAVHTAMDESSSQALFPERPVSVRIGVIKDSAFQFYYPENLEELQRNGAEIVEINAIQGTDLPVIDALYIGGGFPETNALMLARNEDFKEAVRRAAEEGLPIYAECGGLMFLGDAIVMGESRYPMIGIFPLDFEMKTKPQAHGYTIVEVERENPFYPIGTVLHGHEFHYSSVINIAGKEGVYLAFKMKRGRGIYDNKDGMCYKNVLATYTHVHALGSKEWVRGLIKKAKDFKDRHE